MRQKSNPPIYIELIEDHDIGNTSLIAISKLIVMQNWFKNSACQLAYGAIIQCIYTNDTFKFIASQECAVTTFIYYSNNYSAVI